jgi:hypothetical protein
MDQRDAPDEEPSPSDVGQNIAVKSRPAFARIRRELSEDELATPAVQRMLLSEVERLERVETEFVAVRAQFHAVDKRASVLEERHRKWTATEVLATACVAVGSVMLGYAPSFPGGSPHQTITIVLGAALVIAGIVVKAVQR